MENNRIYVLKLLKDHIKNSFAYMKTFHALIYTTSKNNCKIEEKEKICHSQSLAIMSETQHWYDYYVQSKEISLEYGLSKST